eukprot:7076752-Prymnesium_polylepis.1
MSLSAVGTSSLCLCVRGVRWIVRWVAQEGWGAASVSGGFWRFRGDTLVLLFSGRGGASPS